MVKSAFNLRFLILQADLSIRCTFSQCKIRYINKTYSYSVRPCGVLLHERKNFKDMKWLLFFAKKNVNKWQVFALTKTDMKSIIFKLPCSKFKKVMFKPVPRLYFNFNRPFGLFVNTIIVAAHCRISYTVLFWLVY